MVKFLWTKRRPYKRAPLYKLSSCFESHPRLLDHNNSPQKMYTVKFYRSTGKMSIAVSARTRSFFFTNERDNDKVSKERADIINQMQLTHVGFWIRETIPSPAPRMLR